MLEWTRTADDGWEEVMAWDGTYETIQGFRVPMFHVVGRIPPLSAAVAAHGDVDWDAELAGL